MKKIGIIILIVLAITGITVYKVNEWYKDGISRKKYFPPNAKATLAEVEKSIGESLSLTKKENVTLGYAKEPHGIMMGSGPPVYVFDQNNVLIDFTLDQGDDLRFREKWYSESNR